MWIQSNKSDILGFTNSLQLWNYIAWKTGKIKLPTAYLGLLMIAFWAPCIFIIFSILQKLPFQNLSPCHKIVANYTTDRRGPTVVIFSCHMDDHMNFHEWQITSSGQIITALFLEINVWIIARSALAMCTGILQDNNWKCSLQISPCKNSCNWSISLSLYNITIFTLILSPMRYKYYFSVSYIL